MLLAVDCEQLVDDDDGLGSMIVAEDSDDDSDSDASDSNQQMCKIINVGELATALKTNKRVNEVLDKAAAFDPMLFLSEVAVLQDRVASSEDSGMTTMQAVTKESTDLNTPSPVRPVSQKMLPSILEDNLMSEEILVQSAAANNISHVAAGVKRSLQVYNGEEEKKESPKDDWSGKFSVPNTKKRKLSGEEDRQTPTKNEIVFLQGNNDNNDNENGESRSPVPTQQQQLQNKNHRNSPQATTTLFNVQHSPPIATH